MLGTLLEAGVFKHKNCRNNIYPRSDIRRFPVPDDKVFWSVEYKNYSPPIHTSPYVMNEEHDWADPDLPSDTFDPPWNTVDGKINRISLHGKYEIDPDTLPLNPMGRTGLSGRGLLGRWGPNHAADPVVTRWKRDDSGSIITDEASGKKILQMVIVVREDNEKWAIPGGMIDAGETLESALKREFKEEALNDLDEAEVLDSIFQNGKEIYRGYMDDPRNSDNAWVESIVQIFHDETGEKVAKLELNAGDETAGALWADVDGEIEMYANQAMIAGEVAKHLKAHW